MVEENGLILKECQEKDMPVDFIWKTLYRPCATYNRYFLHATRLYAAEHDLKAYHTAPVMWRYEHKQLHKCYLKRKRNHFFIQSNFQIQKKQIT